MLEIWYLLVAEPDASFIRLPRSTSISDLLAQIHKKHRKVLEPFTANDLEVVPVKVPYGLLDPMAEVERQVDQRGEALGLDETVDKLGDDACITAFVRAKNRKLEVEFKEKMKQSLRFWEGAELPTTPGTEKMLELNIVKSRA